VARYVRPATPRSLGRSATWLGYPHCAIACAVPSRERPWQALRGWPSPAVGYRRFLVVAPSCIMRYYPTALSVTPPPPRSGSPSADGRLPATRSGISPIVLAAAPRSVLPS